MTDRIDHPLDAGFLLRHKRSLRRRLLQSPAVVDTRIAILGGSTTAEVRDMLELLLLKDGIRPVFYESDYNRYYEDLLFPNPALEAFAPEFIYLHTSSVNIARFPSTLESEAEALLSEELARFGSLWDQATERYRCPILQNNFELPHHRGLGNLDASDVRGRCRFVSELNRRFAEQASKRANLHLNDIHYLSA
jgi:predicted enzyme involved in methoxymalonyl-ACP biosynthesis